jgi:hypothetical protein
VAPDVTHAVRDDKALRAQFEESFAPQANMAVVEANWVDGPHDLVLAQIILKGMMPERRMTYIGSLIIPFAACSWVIRMQAVEGPQRTPVKSFGLKSTLQTGATSKPSVSSSATDPPTLMNWSPYVGCPPTMPNGTPSSHSTR